MHKHNNPVEIEGIIVNYFLSMKLNNLVGIYLTGSRAGGYNRSDSDWDIHLVFLNKQKSFYSQELKGISMDVKVMDIHEKNPWSDKPLLKTPYSPAYPFKKLWVSSKHASFFEKMEKNTRMTYDSGPGQIPLDEKIDKTLQLRRFLSAAAGEKEINVKLRQLFRFHDLLLQYWYFFEGKFSKTVKQSLKDMSSSRRARVIYKELELLRRCRTPEQMVKQCLKAYNAFIRVYLKSKKNLLLSIDVEV